MGLSDRDYMRDRARPPQRDRPYAPPTQYLGLLWITLFWVAAACILFKLYSAYFPVKQPHKVASVRVQPHDAEPPRVQHRQVRPETPQRHVSMPETRLPEPPAARAPAEVRNTANSSNTIYLCRAYSGGTFWAQAHCNQHSALIERIAYVPPGLPFDQQVAIASEQKRQNAVTVQNQVTVTERAVDPAVAKQAECKSLEARVIQLDAMARQPQSGQMQDWISGQRKEARDRQFRLRC